MMFNITSLDWTEPTDHVELFAGDMSVTRGELQESRNAIAMDLRYSENHDILSDQGFSNMIFQILNLKPGSGHFTAPVCSTWVFMSRGSTGRRKDNPLGSEHYDSVNQANIMVGRVCVLLLLAAAKSIFWILEQPINSLMEHHPIFQALMKLVPIRRMPTHMSWFGGHKEMDHINDYANKALKGNKKAKEMVVHYVRPCCGKGQEQVPEASPAAGSQIPERGFEV
ncbi:Uncharacterized protein SCF082_LOCUS45127 [Durusdinium trenchii]|uniref:Uncharacterized protein n=1 Tax=Durusdinium trenchii TaxID=1381693 RepID=A0ABP0R737_9DINO